MGHRKLHRPAGTPARLVSRFRCFLVATCRWLAQLTAKSAAILLFKCRILITKNKAFTLALEDRRGYSQNMKSKKILE